MSDRAEVNTLTGADDIIAEMARRIVETVNPERIILFGSRAKGNARPDSDVDLMVIESEPFGPGRSRFREAGRLWRALRTFPFSKDILLFSRDEIEQWRAATNHIIAHAMRDGRVIYERTR